MVGIVTSGVASTLLANLSFQWLHGALWLQEGRLSLLLQSGVHCIHLALIALLTGYMGHLVWIYFYSARVTYFGWRSAVRKPSDVTGNCTKFDVYPTPFFHQIFLCGISCPAQGQDRSTVMGPQGTFWLPFKLILSSPSDEGRLLGLQPEGE